MDPTDRPEELDEYVAALEAGAKDKAAAFLPWIRHEVKGRLLDLGAGPGGVLAHIARARPSLSLLGIDRDPRMLRVAQARHGLATNLQFRRADVRDVPNFRATTVVLSSVLHEVFTEDGFDGVEHVFRAANASLVDGGRVLVRDFVRPSNPRLRVHLLHHRRDIRSGRTFDSWANDTARVVPLRPHRDNSQGISYETELEAVYEFMYRKDHGACWYREADQVYGFWAEDTARRIVEAAGLRVVTTQRIPCRWMAEHRLGGRLSLTDASTGEPLPLPAEKLLLVAERA